MNVKGLIALYAWVAVVTTLFLTGLISNGLWLGLGFTPVLVGIILVIEDIIKSVVSLYDPEDDI